MDSVNLTQIRSRNAGLTTRRSFISVYPKVNDALEGNYFGSFLDGVGSLIDGYVNFEEVWRSPLSDSDQQFVATHNDWAMVGQDMLTAMRTVRSTVDEHVREQLPDVASLP